jgi:hypothetical protein
LKGGRRKDKAGCCSWEITGTSKTKKKQKEKNMMRQALQGARDFSCPHGRCIIEEDGIVADK